MDTVHACMHDDRIVKKNNQSKAKHNKLKQRRIVMSTTSNSLYFLRIKIIIII